MVRINIDTKKLKKNAEKLKTLRTGLSVGQGVAEASAGTFFNYMQKVASQAYSTTKDYIKNGAVTPTGVRRGSPRGRYETGAMYDAFIGTPGGGNTAKGTMKFRFEMGWLRGMPNYTLFQEYGTRNGIVAMDAIGYGRDMLAEALLANLAKSKEQYAREVAAGWRSAFAGGKVSTRAYRPRTNWWKKSEVDG